MTLSALPLSSVLFADRYVVEGIGVALLMTVIAAANLWRLSGRVTRMELRLSVLPTKEELGALKDELLVRIDRERTLDDQVLAQANESIKTLRQLNDHQFSVIAQLTQRMDGYLLEELRLSRQRLNPNAAPALAPA